MRENKIYILAKYGDKLTCPGCKETLIFDQMDGWRNDNGLTCVQRTTHSDHIITELQ
ncbi:hypothetical protein SEA_WEASELS2_131 [Rhodococcus phage Weasels2]|uniref:Uncharacterized protein n=1 Tax=Rhodococcus phage Weasels2 TaxID=1897437 RepID=A0A1I9SAB1_9CAUD|nr:hypothetical protein FDH04_gp278 [Rhodococcus phage Weasels2]AOZ63717.1 hypothetical protein SEA_WEASELS2_131 [Rhodococcus phage Weasels2]